MRKKFILVIFFIFSLMAFSAVHWDGEEGRLRVMYKILDPLTVVVDKLNKIRTNTLDKEFTYSSKNNGQKIKVTVSAPYNNSAIDDYLRKIYERVYFSLKNQGQFSLKNQTSSVVTEIKGKGYFVDKEEGITEDKKEYSYSKPFSSRVSESPFLATTEIDVDFKLPQGEVPIGVYKGTLVLDVWFGGTIKN